VVANDSKYTEEMILILDDLLVDGAVKSKTG
jgi:hypothetical protein